MPAMKGKVRNYIHPDNDIYIYYVDTKFGSYNELLLSVYGPNSCNLKETG